MLPFLWFQIPTKSIRYQRTCNKRLSLQQQCSRLSSRWTILMLTEKSSRTSSSLLAGHNEEQPIIPQPHVEDTTPSCLWTGHSGVYWQQVAMEYNTARRTRRMRDGNSFYIQYYNNTLTNRNKGFTRQLFYQHKNNTLCLKSTNFETV